MTVADILSALSQKRSYKEPYPKEKVLAILGDMRESGHICGRVADTVFENYDLILKNTEKSHDPVKTLYEKLRREYAERCAELGCAADPEMFKDRKE